MDYCSISGCGISDEDKSKLFDPFFTTKEVGEGTGLGLYITYLIVQEHNGKIEIDSESTGTEILIALPK